jgi:adenine phosphoribosyltransferase
VSIKDYIRTIPDFPKAGIQFRDITSLLENPEGLKIAIDRIAERYTSAKISHVVGIEARGFIFGTAIAYKMGVGFVPLRKPGKLPGETIGQDYTLEYGKDRIEIHKDALCKDDRVLIVDDLIATGGTAEAAVRLVRNTEATIHECSFVIDLPDLGGIQRLAALGVSSYALCQFEGD